MNIVKSILVLLKDSYHAWKDDNAFLLGAALAFFTIFSLAPVLIVVLSISGLIFGQEAAQSELMSQVRDFVGPKGASTIVTMIERAGSSESNLAAGVFGIGTLLFGASAVFVQLREAINTIWR
ncbi:ribonuclease BN, partial [candidate division KSB1 bacterium]|nr:ribonuclease BN [candidate division KSB1 bacterium]NIR71253.1 ribonuclease BN [candidate division KSB1 bacterium]NIS24782.1 ribonuclease BN [candidate division KSB1 bacterium]NIT71689.1 ribonuclease BN [candidate division KSB1 bacterium]NIU25418.1 ribonuclease BN [candidate division KSB1 bacterium]